MTFGIVWSEKALKQLKKMDRHVAQRILQAVDDLQDNPYRHVKKIVGSESFRFRVGDYRVLVDINNKQLQILVLKLGHRSNIYG